MQSEQNMRSFLE